MRSFISLSAAALTGTAAFLLPLPVGLPSDRIFRIAVPAEASALESFGIDPFSQTVKLSCPGCPYAQFNEQGVSWTREQENYLLLNISVGATQKTLELSGVQIFPAVPSQIGEPEVLQVPAHTTLEQLRAPQGKVVVPHSLRLSAWSVLAKEIHNTKSGQEEIIDLHLRIHAIEQRPVQIPQVIVTAVRNRSGNIVIIKAVPSEKPFTSQDQQADCRLFSVVCKWKALITDRLQTMRAKLHHGCHKLGGLVHKPHYGPYHASPSNIRLHTLLPMHHGKPHHKPHSMPHHMPHSMPHHKPHSMSHATPYHYTHHHRAKHLVRQVAGVLITIFIPLLIGVLAGMLTYLVGMIVGSAIAFIWLKIRTRRSAYASIALGEDDMSCGRTSCEKDTSLHSDSENSPLVSGPES